ncbi:MAG: hypothetical protein D6705_00260 [Deltaproteobacteria bacterium]|nr:MAG: hypothetical protein D6705_00260 [Deltaproteobacteria bacterium]
MPSAGWAPPVDELDEDEEVDEVDEVDDEVGPPLVLDVLLVFPAEVEDVLSVVSPPEDVEPDPFESVAVTPDALPEADSEPIESVPPSVSVPSVVPPWLEPAVVGTVVLALVKALVDESEPTAQPSSMPASEGRRAGSQER